nr:uncharacterized mitochondrial protein AtMg00810-like [Tanacetum cinerariifolium]
KTKREAKGKSPVESLTGYRNLSAEFEDFSNNSINEVNAADSPVLVVGKISTNNTNTFSVAGPSNAVVSPTYEKSSYVNTSQYPDDPNMPELEDITYSDDEEDVATQTRSMKRVAKDQGGLSQQNNDNFHTCMFACFLSQEEPKRVLQALKDPSWIEALQEELLQFKMQKVWVLVDLPYGKRAIGHTQEEGIDYEEVFALVARIEAVRKRYMFVNLLDLRTLIILTRFTQWSRHYMDYIKLLELDGKSASTPIDTEKPLLKDLDSEDVDVHIYRSMIGSLMYLTSSRPDIMFAAYSDSDYAGASLDRKSITGGCQFLGCRLIFWQCKKQIVVATSSTEAEYVAAASCCAQVRWIQNQLLDYGPDQTVSDKDSSNPLMADNLPKIVWYSTHHIALMKSWLVQKQTAIGQTTTGKEDLNLFMADASEWFNQIIDFLNASSIKYALTVNPNIYVSCIKQFWTSVAVKKVNDVTRLQALVDKKKVIITKATIRDALRLADAEGIECLPNKEIFTELSRMGAQVGDLSSYSTKYTSPALTQKVFANMRRVGKGFSGADTPLFEGMIVEQEVGEGTNDVNVEDVHAAGVEGAAGVVDEDVASVVDDDVKFADDEPSIPSPTPLTQPPPPSQDIPSTLQAQLTLPQSPHFQPPSPQQQSQPSYDAEISMDLLHTLLETCTTLTKRVENLEQDKIAQALEITKLKQMVKKLERRNKLKVYKLRRLKKDVILEDAKEVAVEKTVDAEIKESSDVQGRQAESQAEIYQIDLEYAKKVLSMLDEESEPVELQEVVKVVTTTKLKTEVVTAASATITVVDTLIPTATIAAASTLTTTLSATRRRKEVVIRDPKETSILSTIIHTESKSNDNGKGIMNMAGFKMDYFRGMSYDDIRPIFEKKFNSNVAFLEKTKEQIEEEDSRALKRISESQKDKVAKRQKLDEEVKELRRHLQIVQNNDDDVYTESTPLALKVPVVDYEIYNKHNKPYYKIKRADNLHQLYLSFLSMLRNFDREDLEAL